MTPGRLVECAQHGATRPSFVCQHLLQSLKTGESCEVNWTRDEDNQVNAWCDQCDDYLLANGNEWNDKTEAFASIKLICEDCFGTLKTTNPTKEFN